jgi:hypothetical protein
MAAGLRCAYAAQSPDSVMSGSNNKIADGQAVPDRTTEGFALRYELTGVGWAHAKVSVGSDTHETEVSYLTRDPLGQLAEALVGYIWPEDGTFFVVGKRAAKVDVEELRSRGFAWEDEPGGWQWTLRPHGAAAVKVKLEQRSSQSRGEPLVDSICSLREMATACAASIEGLLLKHGVVGYRLKWMNGDLPLAQYLLLKRWLQSPGYVAKDSEGGSWQEDLAALRRLGV